MSNLNISSWTLILPTHTSFPIILYIDQMRKEVDFNEVVYVGSQVNQHHR